MSDRAVRLPGPDHPITIEPHPKRVVVTVGGKTVADTQEALILREASYPGVVYVPRKDVDLSLLVRTDHSTWCPYKGDASYYSIPSGGDRSVNAIWTYEAAHPAVAEIDGHMAFYPDRIDSLQERPLD
jgi:uncharacterized protein (DUF427 family)